MPQLAGWHFLRTIVLAAAAGVYFCAGCQRVGPPTDAQRQLGLIWVFPGVEGGPRSMSRAVKAYRDIGATSAIEIHDWQRPFGLIANLVALERNRKDATDIARKIAEHKRAFPEAAVDLVGYSGGGGMAVMVAEALPPDVHVRNVVLLQPALSPDYDLTAALSHVDGKLVNFYSKLDWVILGLGTYVLGTMDRKHTESAGRVGFTIELAVPDVALRSRVVQHRWTADMTPTGHYGGHFAILLYEWNKKYVAPYLAPTRK